VKVEKLRDSVAALAEAPDFIDLFDNESAEVACCGSGVTAE
jgi:hypothetical protein